MRLRADVLDALPGTRMSSLGVWKSTPVILGHTSRLPARHSVNIRAFRLGRLRNRNRVSSQALVMDQWPANGTMRTKPQTSAGNVQKEGQGARLRFGYDVVGLRILLGKDRAGFTMGDFTAGIGSFYSNVNGRLRGKSLRSGLDLRLAMALLARVYCKCGPQSMGITSRDILYHI